MPYFANLKAPDISHLGATLQSRTITGFLFQGLKVPDHVSTARLLTGYLIVTDKAIREYSAARDTLIAYSQSTNNIEQFTKGLGQFETCIHSIKRAFRFLEKITAHPECPMVDRTLRHLIRNKDDALTSLRNSIEHIEEEISAEKELTTGMAHMLTINHGGEYLEISIYQIALADLSMILCNLHKAGCQLLVSLTSMS